MKWFRHRFCIVRAWVRHSIPVKNFEFFEFIVLLLILLNCNTMDRDQGSSRSRKVLTYTKSLISLNVCWSKFMFIMRVFSAQVHSQAAQSSCSQNVIQQIHFEFLISLQTLFSDCIKKLLRCSKLDNKQDEDSTPARLLSRRYVSLFTPHSSYSSSSFHCSALLFSFHNFFWTCISKSIAVKTNFPLRSVSQNYEL